MQFSVTFVQDRGERPHLISLLLQDLFSTTFPNRSPKNIVMEERAWARLINSISPHKAMQLRILSIWLQ